MQERSRERVERILEGAMALVDEQGTPAVTTRAIAAKTGIPVASIYQFFANREEILEQLVMRSIEGLDQRLADDLSGLHPNSVGEAVDLFLERQRVHHHEHPEFVALYYAGRANKSVLFDVREHQARLATIVRTLLIDRGVLRPDTDPVVIEVAIQLGDRIHELAHRRTSGGDPQVLAEGRIALVRYLEVYATG